ncbi:MAG: precorrin-6A reductase [Lachnospiraceae bacterium]|nr:precorrin-6A reductase [Candidatus Merdinaster equi]
MKQVLIFAGTTEGRELAEAFDRSNISCHVCVATEYGSQLIKDTRNVIVHMGRLDGNDMKELMSDIKCDVVVDATHPYATAVTSTIMDSIKDTDIEYIRLLRDTKVENSNADIAYYADVNQCIEGLKLTSGKILLTTGSKQLAEFTGVAELKDRIMARVIPGMESLKLCYDAGLEGRQIIAMQGPFSQQMNEAVIREYNIENLVTKESGAVGGVNDKLLAAANLGIKVHMIGSPNETVNGSLSNGKEGLSLGKTIKKIEQLLGMSFARGKVQVVLAGIGPGNERLMTEEVKSEISEADIIFGATRMVEAVESKAKKYPYYLREDIIPVIENESAGSYKDIKAVVLFSGDSGFYSGSRKMYEALIQKSEWDVRIMPGVSSISLLCARLGTDWNDGNIVSLHGVDSTQWIPEILDSVRYNRKTFFICSGVKDINLLGEVLYDEGIDCQIHLGYQLSYPDEKVLALSLQQCMELGEEGLYAGLITVGDVSRRFLVPTMKDEDFIRDNVPMTKEDVRKLSICQMKIKENDVVYDIGCGSGSIAVQAAMLSRSVRVYAVECSEEAVALSRRNISKHRLHNIDVIQAKAPGGLDNLPAADSAFIGGSRGNLKDILLKLYAINPSMRVVINAVSMETICETSRLIEELSIDNLSIEQVSVNKVNELGQYHMLSSNNSVFIFSFDFV